MKEKTTKNKKQQFDPVKWSRTIELHVRLKEIHTHIYNVRRSWNRGNTADMVWQAEKAELKIQNLLDDYAKESNKS